MRNELAGVLIDFAERADNNGEDVASVECPKGRLEWTRSLDRLCHPRRLLAHVSDRGRQLASCSPV